MGYRSYVRVMTNLEDFEEMREIAREMKENENLPDNVILFPVPGQDPEEVFDYYDAQEDYLCFGFDWVKWYDNYKDVSCFMRILKYANAKGLQWQFIRIGEEFDDVEMDYSDSFYDNPPAVMRVDAVINY